MSVCVEKFVPFSRMHHTFPIDIRRPLSWGQLYGASPALMITAAATSHCGLILAIAPNSQMALRLETELRVFGGSELDILSFPDWETLPYDLLSPSQEIISQRLSALYQLPSRTHGVLIVPATTLMQRLAPRNYLDNFVLILTVGNQITHESFRQKIERSGYACVSKVVEHGEFAVRGSIFDLFPMGAEQPYRIEIFDDNVKSIRSFDPETQRTVSRVESIELLPAREFPFDKEAIARFRKTWRRQFEGDPQLSVVSALLSL